MELNRKVIEEGTRRILLKSKDSFLIEDYLEKLKAAFPEYSYQYCSDLELFHSLCTTDSLFSTENRIIVYPRIDKESLETLAAVAGSASKDILVFLETEAPLKLKSYTILKSLCTLAELKSLTESECSVQIRVWLKDYGITYSSEVPLYLASQAKADMHKIKNDINKIVMYLSRRKTKELTKELVNEISFVYQETQFFSFVENLFKKKIVEVLSEFKRLEEESYVRLLHFIISQIHRIYKVSIYKEQGMSVEEIGELIGVPAFIVRTKIITVLSFYGKIKLIQLLDLFNKLDLELRSSKYAKDLLFETYLIKAFKL